MKKKAIITVFLILTAIGITAQAAWYDSEVADCKKKDFVSAELFENLDEYITRGEVCDLLVSYYEHKNSDIDIAKKDNSFTDISESKYKEAIEKAYSLNIINGMTDTEFAPDENITREQFVCLIYRMNGSQPAETFIYDDANEISDYALSAIDYSVANKIVMGTEKGYFSPQANITKAQAIVIVNRLDSNLNLQYGDKKYSNYVLRSETKDYISYITRKFDMMVYRSMLSRGNIMENRPLDTLVIIDKETEERKLIELEKIVSLHFFDIGDTLYIPICKESKSGISDLRTQGMYVVDKKTGHVEEIETPVLVKAFAMANGCVYYRTNVSTGEYSIRPTVSKYNLETKQIFMSDQGSIGEFDGNILLYLDENEAVYRRAVGNIADHDISIYTIDLNSLKMTMISKEPIIAINDNYYVVLTDNERVLAAIYDRKTGELIRNINLEDELYLVSEGDLSLEMYNNTYFENAYMLRDFNFFDVNGELYVRYKDENVAVCITNKDMFDLDFFYYFFDNGYAPNDSYFQKDKSFFIINPLNTIPSSNYYESVREDAAVASIYSRKVYGADSDLKFVIDRERAIREFCAEYKRKYQNPYELIRALNEYLTYECTYDRDTYLGLPTDRKYSAYSAAGIIIEKSGVCSGYADTVEKVLSYSGIKCMTVTGFANNDEHAWSLIEIDGTKYYLDATWNSSHRDADAYYMMSYDEISRGHYLDEKYKYMIN